VQAGGKSSPSSSSQMTWLTTCSHSLRCLTPNPMQVCTASSCNPHPAFFRSRTRSTSLLFENPLFFPTDIEPKTTSCRRRFFNIGSGTLSVVMVSCPPREVGGVRCFPLAPNPCPPPYKKWLGHIFLGSNTWKSPLPPLVFPFCLLELAAASFAFPLSFLPACFSLLGGLGSSSAVRAPGPELPARHSSSTLPARVNNILHCSAVNSRDSRERSRRLSTGRNWKISIDNGLLSWYV